MYNVNDNNDNDNYDHNNNGNGHDDSNDNNRTASMRVAKEGSKRTLPQDSQGVRQTGFTLQLFRSFKKLKNRKATSECERVIHLRN